jgi:hypothetical protein
MVWPWSTISALAAHPRRDVRRLEQQAMTIETDDQWRLTRPVNERRPNLLEGLGRHVEGIGPFAAWLRRRGCGVERRLGEHRRWNQPANQDGDHYCRAQHCFYSVHGIKAVITAFLL